MATFLGPDPEVVDAAVIRGIYAEEEELDPEFKRVKKFSTKAEALAWYESVQRVTNPQPGKYGDCNHIYTHLVDWDQTRRFVLHKAEYYRKAFPVRPPTPIPDANVYRDHAAIVASIALRLDRPFHASTNEESSLNTLRYLFFHMRCGIFVMIREGRVKLFAPFVNKDYVNAWGGAMTLEGDKTPDKYYSDKARTLHRRKEHVLQEIDRWWANGNIICNEPSPRFWGDAYLTQTKDMLEELCANRTVDDCEFFINKRDFPHLKVSSAGELTEPYEFIFDRDDVPLAREVYTHYAPVGSFFVSPQFADLGLTCTDDWETATGMVYPPGGNDIRSAAKRGANLMAWDERKPTAIFRGNSTGPGCTVEDNQRLKLAAISQAWKTDPAFNEHNPIDGVPYLDAGVVGFNARDRKVQGKPMSFIKPKELHVKKVPRVEMYQQQQYKYQIYADGHVAAMRYASMMVLGSVILRTESYTKAGDLWFFPVLKAWDIHSDDPDQDGDHLHVDRNFENLAEVLTWCKQHDAECQRMVANATALYEKLMSKEGQMDYMQLVFHEVATRFQSKRKPTPVTSPATAAAPLTVVWEPDNEKDWFGLDNDEYVSVDLAKKPPVLLDLKRDCACPACQKEKAKEQEMVGALFALAGGGGGADGGAAGEGFGAGAGAGAGGGAGAGAGASTGAPAPPPPPPKPSTDIVTVKKLTSKPPVSAKKRAAQLKADQLEFLRARQRRRTEKK